jgi:probable HAF family extracellular repeat protein
MRRIALLASLVATGILAGSSLAAPAAKRWQITDLGTLGGSYKDCVAAAINGSGQIAGGCGDARGRQHAFVWDKGTLTYLGTLGGHDSGASLINDRGQIAGTSLTAKPAHVHGFLWQHGRMTDLGTLGGKTNRPRALNDRGQVVGESERSDGAVHAFLWQNGKLTDLGTLGGRNSIALAVNDSGQVVGAADTASGKEHAFLWQSGKMRDLGTLGSTYPSSRAVAVNALGQVVGTSYSDVVTSTGTRSSAFLWARGRMAPLRPASRSDQDSTAVAVNDRGQVAGWGDDVHGGFHPLVWQHGTARALGTLSRGYTDVAAIDLQGRVIGTSVPARAGAVHAVVWAGGKVTDLGTLGGEQSSADAINGSGQIVGTAWLRNGHRHAVLWTLR